MLIKTTLAAIFILFSHSVNAREQVIIRHNAYVVTGSTLQEIDRSIRKGGFHVSENGSFAAKTDYAINWQPIMENTDSGCLLKDVYITIEIEYSLPALAGYNKLSDLDKESWSKYYKALKAHEERHGYYAIEAARQFKWQAGEVFSAQNCDNIRRSLRKMAGRIFARYNEMNIAFDRRSNHGHKDGAYLLASISK